MSEEILIIEDSGFFVRAYSKVLTEAGYRVLIACDGRSGMNTAESCHPSLIILDLLIPGMTGIEVLRKLKRSATLRDIPVLVVSCLSEANGKKLILEGAVGFCHKTTITADTLRTAVDDALRNRVLVPQAVQYPMAVVSNKRASR